MSNSTLPPHREPMRRTPLRAYSVEGRRRAAVQASSTRGLAKTVTGSPPLTQAVKDAVRLRDGVCLSCGQNRRELLVVNHRYAGMGGYRFQRIHALTLACLSCNLAYEAEWYGLALANGWRLRHCSDDNAQALAEPVVDHAGNHWLLDAAGSRVLADRKEAE